MSTDNEQNKNEKLAAELAKAKREIETLKREKRRVGLSFHRIPETGHDISRLWNGDFPYLQKLPDNCLEKPVTDETFHADANTVLIEADNLAALMAMQLTHKGQIDVIYIDPPYNTGNNDFIYNDARKSSIKDVDGASASDYETNLDGKARAVGKDDPERHSLWLSFMERRLWLAKELLSPTGVIFISIDDNEYAHLKVLMDSIFGESNHVDTLMVELSGTQGMKVGAAQQGRIVKNGEYVLIYSKSDALYDVVRTPLYDNVSNYDKHFNMYLNDDNSLISLGEHLMSEPKIKKEITSITGLDGTTISVDVIASLIHKSPLVKSYIYETISNRIYRQMMASINVDKLLVESLSSKIVTEFVSSNEKKYLLVKNASGNIEQLMPLKNTLQWTDDFYPSYGRATIRGDFWKDFNKDMMNISKEGGVDFKNGKKPLRLIRQLIKWAVGANKNAVIMDFFAGSGTTGNAVAELNTVDGGSRQCILITHGDEAGKNIAEDVTAERMKRVLSGKNWADGKEHEPLIGSFYYYKLLFAPKTTNPLTAMETMQTRFTGLAAMEQDTHVQLENESNYTVLMNSEKIVVVWKNGDALLDEPEIEFYPLLERVKEENKGKALIVYTPSTSLSNSDEYGVSHYGWTNYSFPMEYIQAHDALLERMKRNKTMLQPYVDDTVAGDGEFVYTDAEVDKSDTETNNEDSEGIK